VQHQIQTPSYSLATSLPATGKGNRPVSTPAQYGNHGPQRSLSPTQVTFRRRLQMPASLSNDHSPPRLPCLLCSMYQRDFLRKICLIYYIYICQSSSTLIQLWNLLALLVYHTSDRFWKDDQPCPPYALLFNCPLANPQLASQVKYLKLRGCGLVRKHI
jgi:hypothetical protein